MSTEVLTDSLWMKKAIFFASLSKGVASPNPTVGAVLVNEFNDIVSYGVTTPSSFHAEYNALKDLPLSKTENTTLYVTLEPCCFEGNTPACTDIIIEKKVKRVVVGILDSHSKVNGRGIELLRQKGIEVSVGCLEKECYQLHKEFLYAMTHKRPFVTVKYASSLDGVMGLESNTVDLSDRWVSSDRSRKLSHLLRLSMDAILVGAQTVIDDNPTLNARTPSRVKNLLRVVLDKDAKIPLNSKVLSDEKPTLWVVNKKMSKKSFIKDVLSRKNKEVFFISHPENSLLSLLEFLYKEKKVLSLMVEGGGNILGEFLKQRFINEAFVFFSPYFFGQGIKAFSSHQLRNIKEAPLLENKKVKLIDKDILICGKVIWPPAQK